MKNYQLIYIGPFGYSGSTLVDMYLSKYENIFSIGEAISYSTWKAENRLCTCRELIHECDFWSKINHTPSENSSAFSRAANNNLPNITGADGLRAYGEDQWVLLDKIASVCDANYIVDSSKSLWRLKALALTRPSKIIACHLIRHPYDVMTSAQIRKLKPSIPADKNVAYTKSYPKWRTALKWVLQNHAFQKFCASHEITYLKISYEVFVEKPIEVIRKMGIDGGTLKGEGNTIIPAENHNISGSRWRLLQDRVSIRSDLKSTKMSRHSIAFKLSDYIYEHASK